MILWVSCFDAFCFPGFFQKMSNWKGILIDQKIREIEVIFFVCLNTSSVCLFRNINCIYTDLHYLSLCFEHFSQDFQT